MALAATSEAIGQAWAPEVALEIARAWADRREQILLVDAHLGAPVLHELVGVPNAEGLSDALLYGGSVQRSAVSVDDDAFFLVTAGTVVADPATALESERWARFCGAFRGAGVTLVVYVPAEQPWAESVLSQATDIIYLATPGDTPIERLGRASQVRSILGVWGALPVEEEPEALIDPLEVIPLPIPDIVEPVAAATVGPAASPVEAAEEIADVGEDEDEPVPEAADEYEDVREAYPIEEPSTVPHTETSRPGQLGLEPSPSKKVRGSGSTGRRALLVAGATAAAVVAIVMLRSSSNVAQPERPDAAVNAVGPEATPAPAEVEPTDVPPPAPTPVGAAWDYSLAIGSFRDLEDATTYQSRLAAEAGSTWFGLAPLVVNGTVFNRILAGLASDSLGAEGMKAQIGSTVDEDAGPWYARPAGLAFLLGEFATLSEATERAEAVTDDGVPSYVFAVAYSDGSEHYRVYAGAYGTEAEAAHLGTELQSRSLPTSLVQRIGRLPR